jgi:hypothetical protein
LLSWPLKKSPFLRGKVFFQAQIFWGSCLTAKESVAVLREKIRTRDKGKENSNTARY